MNKSDQSDKIIIRVPDEWAKEFPGLWDSWRLAEGLRPEMNLGEPQSMSRFDGGGLVEWIVPIAKGTSILAAAAIGFISARKGEIEIRRKGEVLKFRNIRPSEIKEIIDLLARDSEK